MRHCKPPEAASKGLMLNWQTCKEKLSEHDSAASSRQRKLEADLAAMIAERDTARRDADLSVQRAVRQGEKVQEFV